MTAYCTPTAMSARFILGLNSLLAAGSKSATAKGRRRAGEVPTVGQVGKYSVPYWIVSVKVVVCWVERLARNHQAVRAVGGKLKKRARERVVTASTEVRRRLEASVAIARQHSHGARQRGSPTSWVTTGPGLPSPLGFRAVTEQEGSKL